MSKEGNDIIFGSPAEGRIYKSVYYHQKNSKPKKGKTRWVIFPNEEYALFCIGEGNKWGGERKLFAFFDDYLEVGENGEIIGQFDGSREGIEWHGHPVKGYKVNSDLLDRWEEDELISKSMKRKFLNHSL